MQLWPLDTAPWPKLVLRALWPVALCSDPQSFPTSIFLGLLHRQSYPRVCDYPSTVGARSALVLYRHMHSVLRACYFRTVVWLHIQPGRPYARLISKKNRNLSCGCSATEPTAHSICALRAFSAIVVCMQIRRAFALRGRAGGEANPQLLFSTRTVKAVLIPEFRPLGPERNETERILVAFPVPFRSGS